MSRGLIEDVEVVKPIAEPGGIQGKYPSAFICVFICLRVNYIDNQ